MTTKELPVIANADFINGYWTNNPPSYYAGAGGRSQHPGPQVGWTSADPATRQPVYGQSGQPGHDPVTGKITLPKR